MDDDLEDCDYDIDLGNEDEDALLADDFQDSGQYDQTAEDVLDLNPENDLECELLTPNVSKQYNDSEASFTRTQEEEPDTNQEESFETSHGGDSFNALHDESDEEDKDNSNRDRFKSERSQILPPTSSNPIPDSLETVVARLPPPEAPRDRWQHGRRGKRGAGGRPTGQIRPSFRPPFAPPYQNRGNQNQRGGFRPRFQHRGSNNNVGGNAPNAPTSKKILINPHFQGVVQPSLGSGRLVWDTAVIQDPPPNTFQPPTVEHFQPGRPEEPGPWTFHEQHSMPSPWLEGFGPGSEPNAHAQQHQLQQQQQHHQNQQHHHPDMRYQQPNAHPVQTFPQPQPFGSNDMEQARFQEQRRINQERERLNKMEEERQREMDYQNRWDENQRQEMMRMEESAQNYDRLGGFNRNGDNFNRHERGMQDGPGPRTFSHPHFSGPPPSTDNFFPGPSSETSDLAPFPNSARHGPQNHQMPPLFTQPPPRLPHPLGQHNQAPPMLNNIPMRDQGLPGFDRPPNLNNQGPAMHNNPPGFHHHQHPYQNTSNTLLGDDGPLGLRIQVPPLPYRSPVGSHLMPSEFEIPELPALPRTISRDLPPQQMPTGSFGQPIRTQPQTNERNQQQAIHNRNAAMQGGRQPPQMRPMDSNVYRPDPNRRVVQQVRTANIRVRTNLQQVRSIETTQVLEQRGRTYQDQEPRAPRQQITTQNREVPPIRRQLPSIRPQSSSKRPPGPPIQRNGPTIRQPGPGIRPQQPPVRQQGPSVVQQGASNRQLGSPVRQQGPSNRLLGQKIQTLTQAQAGPPLQLVSASKRQLAPAEEDVKRVKLLPVSVKEEPVDRYLEETVDEEEDAELRNYRLQIEKQKKIRDAVFLAKETRRKQAAQERLLAQEKQQMGDVDGDEPGAFL